MTYSDLFVGYPKLFVNETIHHTGKLYGIIERARAGADFVLAVNAEGYRIALRSETVEGDRVEEIGHILRSGNQSKIIDFGFVKSALDNYIINDYKAGLSIPYSHFEKIKADLSGKLPKDMEEALDNLLSISPVAGMVAFATILALGANALYLAGFGAYHLLLDMDSCGPLLKESIKRACELSLDDAWLASVRMVLKRQYL